jgi:hypothetical protein
MCSYLMQMYVYPATTIRERLLYISIDLICSCLIDTFLYVTLGQAGLIVFSVQLKIGLLLTKDINYISKFE